MLIDFDPIALDLGIIAIRWYGLAYLVGFMGALYWAKFLLQRLPKQKYFGITADHLEQFLTYAIFGVILGGRLGEVIFYHPQYYLSRPAEILMIWNGGMSFHGGVIGVAVAMFLFVRLRRLPFRALADMVCVGIPIGLFFGRIANFINGELWGRITDVPWAVIIPQSGTTDLRHPSALYEAFAEGFVLFILLGLAVRLGALRFQGRVAGLFFAGYAVARTFSEFFREPEAHQGLLIWGTSYGQWLSLPMLLIGLWVVYSASEQSKLR